MKLTIDIPQSINDITLDQYQRFYAIYDEKADKDFINRKALDIFYGIDAKNYNGLKVKDIDHIINELNKAIEQKIKLVNEFKLNDINYAFIPDLDDITLAEFADMDGNQGLDKMHRLMSILFRPIKDKKNGRYRIKTYKGTNDDLRGMPLGIALSAMDFFLTIAIQLTKSTLNSLKPQDQAQRQKLNLAKNGLGTLQSMSLRVGIY